MLAVILDEAQGSACRACLGSVRAKLISARTLTEFLIVSSRRAVEPLARRLTSAALHTEPVTRERAEAAAGACRRWGKSLHAAHLNHGDCFAYALAQEFGCPLLYVGDNFAQTDVRSALA